MLFTVYNPASQISFIDENFVLDLLKKGAIDRNDFVGNFEEIMAEGKVRDGSELIIKKVLFGEREIEKVKVKVDDQIGDIMLIGSDILEKVPFTADDGKMQLIFK